MESLHSIEICAVFRFMPVVHIGSQAVREWIISIHGTPLAVIAKSTPGSGHN